jgi:hypothetical protein
MIWVSEADEEISSYDALGPHPLPAAKPGAEARYLMDGVQRVSTLYGALRARENWSDFDEESDSEIQDFIVYADLDADRDSDRFQRLLDIGATQISIDPSRYLPLNIVLDSRELLRFQREVPGDREHRVDAADEVAASFRQFKIPLITLNSASLEVVTKSFERINSRGADMSELHMLNALTYSPNFDLLKRDKELRQALLRPVGWESIDDDVVLRCLKIRVGADLYKTNPDDVSQRLKDDPTELERVFIGLARCGEFLKAGMGITDPSLVPYQMQIIALSAALFDQDWESVEQPLVDWMWLSTYTEVFASSARQSENALRDLLTLASSGVFSWSLRSEPSVRPLSDLRTDFRSARVKALAFALAARADEVAGDMGRRLMLRYGRDAFYQMPLEGAERGKAGFRFWIDPTEAGSLKARLINQELSDDDKSTHLISDEALDYLEMGLPDVFADIRARDIFEYEKETILTPAADRLRVGVAGVNAPPLFSWA